MSTKTADRFDMIPGVKEFHHGTTTSKDKKDAMITILVHHDCSASRPIAATMNAPIDNSQKMPKTFPTADCMTLFPGKTQGD
jgi:hypothetical protein